MTHLIRLILATLGNLIDTAATLHLYLADLGDELNPISEILLRNPIRFTAVKLIAMSIATTYLWWKRDTTHGKILSWVLCVEYVAIAIYYIVLYTVYYPQLF